MGNETKQDGMLSQTSMPDIKKAIVEKNFMVFLCENNSVWTYGKSKKGMLGLGETTEAVCPIEIEELKDIINIFYTGSTLYALTKEGQVFGWGENIYNMISFLEKDKGKIYNSPVKIDALSDIVSFDAKNEIAFAVDGSGRLFCWGKNEPLGLGFNGYYKDFGEVINYPFSYENAIIRGVKEVICGAGQYSYFIRSDGTMFSIIGGNPLLSESEPFPIYPSIHSNETFSTLKIESIGPVAELGSSILYELYGITNVKNTASDDYTMFILRDDELWYWYSNRVKYHDNSRARYRPDETNGFYIDYSGDFKKIELPESTNGEKVIEIEAGKENVLFLSNVGSVWISNYILDKIEDVEFYIMSTSSSRTLFTDTIENMQLKRIDINKLNLQNIVGIYSDGGYNFTAVNREGTVYKISTESKFMQEVVFDLND